jgi:hypothetical protein
MNDEIMKMVEVYNAAQRAYDAALAALVVAGDAGILNYDAGKALVDIQRAALEKMVDVPDVHGSAKESRDIVLRDVAVRGHFEDIVTPKLLKSLGCPTRLFED